MERSKELSQILKASKHYGFRNILIGDQMWFTLSYCNNGAWLDFDEKPPQIIDDYISYEKVMVTIVYGFFIVDFLTKGESYKSEYFISNILEPLSDQRQEIWKESTRRKIWLHLDNTKVHNSKLTSGKYDILGFKRTPHLAYSPDIAPSDFYSFGFMVEKYKGRKFNDINEFFESIQENLDSISIETRKAVF